MGVEGLNDLRYELQRTKWQAAGQLVKKYDDATDAQSASTARSKKI